jgi:transposase-like protein
LDEDDLSSGIFRVIIIFLSPYPGLERFAFWMRRKQALRERGAPFREKDVILAEANVAGVKVSAVARAHVSVHQLFRWRREAPLSSPRLSKGLDARPQRTPRAADERGLTLRHSDSGQDRGATNRRVCACLPGMDGDFHDLPDDLSALKAMISDIRRSNSSLEAEVAALKAASADAQANVCNSSRPSSERPTGEAEKLNDSQYAFAFEEFQTGLAAVEARLEKLRPPPSKPAGGVRCRLISSGSKRSSSRRDVISWLAGWAMSASTSGRSPIGFSSSSATGISPATDGSRWTLTPL